MKPIPEQKTQNTCTGSINMVKSPLPENRSAPKGMWLATWLISLFLIDQFNTVSSVDIKIGRYALRSGILSGSNLRAFTTRDKIACMAVCLKYNCTTVVYDIAQGENCFLLTAGNGTASNNSLPASGKMYASVNKIATDGTTLSAPSSSTVPQSSIATGPLLSTATAQPSSTATILSSSGTSQSSMSGGTSPPPSSSSSSHIPSHTTSTVTTQFHPTSSPATTPSSTLTSSAASSTALTAYSAGTSTSPTTAMSTTRPSSEATTPSGVLWAQ